MECAGSGAWLMCKAARLARDLANHQKVGTRKGRDGTRCPKKRERGGTLEVGGTAPILVCDLVSANA